MMNPLFVILYPSFGHIILYDESFISHCVSIIWTPLTKMKRLLQCCGSVAATLQQLDMYATTGGDKVAN